MIFPIVSQKKEVSWNGGIPSLDFPWNKPTIFGDPLFMETSIIYGDYTQQ